MDEEKRDDWTRIRVGFQAISFANFLLKFEQVQSQTTKRAMGGDILIMDSSSILLVLDRHNRA